MIAVQEEAWLYTAKMAGYGISIVLLLVYILTIQVLCPLFKRKMKRILTFYLINLNI